MLNCLKRLIWIFSFMLLTNQLTVAQSLKAMSYNIRYDNPNDDENRWDHRKQALADLINHYEPAVLGIQEGLYHQVTFLDSSLVNYSYFGMGRKDGKTKGEFTTCSPNAVSYYW